MKITVEKPDDAKIQEMSVLPVWEKEASTFDWEYDMEETCYLTDGDVVIRTEDGDVVEFGAGDLVIFPKGLKCVWEIRKAVRKHYVFR
jgi:uncharacterized protein